MPLIFIKDLESFTVETTIYQVPSLYQSSISGCFNIELSPNKDDILISAEEPCNIIKVLCANGYISSIDMDDIPNTLTSNLYLIRDCLDPFFADFSISKLLKESSEIKISDIPLRKQRLEDYPEHSIDVLDYIDDHLVGLNFQGLSICYIKEYRDSNVRWLNHYFDTMFDAFYKKEAVCVFAENFKDQLIPSIEKACTDPHAINLLEGMFIKRGISKTPPLYYVQGSSNFAIDFKTLHRKCLNTPIEYDSGKGWSYNLPLFFEQVEVSFTVDFKTVLKDWVIPNSLMDVFNHVLEFFDFSLFFGAINEYEIEFTPNPYLTVFNDGVYTITFVSSGILN